jgi:hypothetical protein
MEKDSGSISNKKDKDEMIIKTCKFIYIDILLYLEKKLYFLIQDLF